jgi:hypothetical protein
MKVQSEQHHMPALLLLARLCEPTAGEDKNVMVRHDYATYKMRAVAGVFYSAVLLTLHG